MVTEGHAEAEEVPAIRADGSVTCMEAAEGRRQGGAEADAGTAGDPDIRVIENKHTTVGSELDLPSGLEMEGYVVWESFRSYRHAVAAQEEEDI